MTQDTNRSPDAVAALVGEVGEHLSNIYLGKDNSRRQEFVGRLEEMVRMQLKKEQFALVNDVAVQDVVSASEALSDTPGTDKPMSPMRVKEDVAKEFFKDSRAMETSYDVVVSKADVESALANRYERVKTAFDMVKADICNCPWNPDSHATDCPVSILETAIYGKL